MKPVAFTCSEVFPISPEQLCREIARVDRWSEFAGHGIVPGILRAEYERRTDTMVGSRIRVWNRDGSRHVEEVLEWIPDRRVVLRLAEFSPPLDRFSDGFVEEWAFRARPQGTHVSRTLTLHPRSRPARVLLWLVSLFLRRAITAHLAQLKGSGAGTG